MRHREHAPCAQHLRHKQNTQWIFHALRTPAPGHSCLHSPNSFCSAARFIRRAASVASQFACSCASSRYIFSFSLSFFSKLPCQVLPSSIQSCSSRARTHTHTTSAVYPQILTCRKGPPFQPLLYRTLHARERGLRPPPPPPSLQPAP
jgi:hypothetical protein